MQTAAAVNALYLGRRERRDSDPSEVRQRCIPRLHRVTQFAPHRLLAVQNVSDVVIVEAFQRRRAISFSD